MIGRPLTSSQSLVYRALEAAAERREYCPKNDELADVIGAASAQTPGHIIVNLERYGLIQVERLKRYRRVTIVRTGRSTR